VTCNNNCVEPVNFAYVQTNGVPPGPPAPQDPNAGTFFGNAHTLKMNGGDVLKVSFTDPASGFTARIQDLTTHQSGFMQASSANGFTDTNMSDCSGNPFTWHAEYSTARQQNQSPWPALESGVLMEQEIGHGEACASLSAKEGFSATFGGGSSVKDPKVFQTCGGGQEGNGATGEGPCNPRTGRCAGSRTEGIRGPFPCTRTTTDCEFSDGACFPKGTRTATVNGSPVKEFEPVDLCLQTDFENGDHDFDGTGYRADWPNGSADFPQTFRYSGPFTNGHAYPQVQYETEVGATEQLCNPATGLFCTVPPIGGAGFYPFWSLTNKQTLPGVTGLGACLWNFGNDIRRITTHDFGKDAQYGKPDTTRFGGTIISKVLPNPALAKDCKPV
jgi:hypothetical protein